MFRDAALTVTSPAFPTPSVVELINAPLAIVIAPTVLTNTSAAVPLDPLMAELEIPVANAAGPPSINNEFAVTVTSPEFPVPWEMDAMPAPSAIVVAPMVATVTRPAVPLELAALMLAICVTALDGPPSTLSEPAVSVTSPESPAAKVSDRICPPLPIVAAAATFTCTVPPFAVVVVDASIPVNQFGLGPEITSDPALSVMSAPGAP